MLSEHFGCWARHAPLTLFDCAPVRSTHAQCTRQASDMTCDIRPYPYGPGKRDGASGFERAAGTVASCSFVVEEFDR